MALRSDPNFIVRPSFPVTDPLFVPPSDKMIPRNSFICNGLTLAKVLRGPIANPLTGSDYACQGEGARREPSAGCPGAVSIARGGRRRGASEAPACRLRPNAGRIQAGLNRGCRG